MANRWKCAAPFVIALVVAWPAHATTCIPAERESVRIRTSFAQADQVFSARVEEIFHGPMFGREQARMAKLRVIQVWKGTLEPGGIVTSSADGDTQFISGGLEPPLGGTILAYVSGAQPFVLGACGRTGMLEDREHDLRMFRKLAPRAASD